jgi:bilirubin oxidase
MTLKLSWIAAASCLLGGSLAQTLESNVAPEEEAAIAAIVEDDPADVVSLFKSGESPEFPLIFKVPLPIPPIKEPKM